MTQNWKQREKRKQSRLLVWNETRVEKEDVRVVKKKVKKEKKG